MKDLLIFTTSTYLSCRSFILDWSKRVTCRHSISKKISYGYAATLMMAVVGTTAGMITGEYYQQQAQEQKEYAQQEIRLLNRLESSILQAQAHQQQLIYLVKKPEVLQQEYSCFLNYTNEVKQIDSELTSFKSKLNKAPLEESPKEIEMLRRIHKTYQNYVEEYIQQTKKLFKAIEPFNLKAEKFEAVQKRLWDFNQDPQHLKIVHISDDLADLLKLAYEEQEEAEASLSRVEVLRVQIVGVSMLMSVMCAIVLAIYNTRMIAHPIQAVTAVAQQVTQEGNFDLQAPVTTNDEVGLLAVSLNRLVRWVGQYTKELEQARQTLEIRVDERTQELSQKNQQLLQAHEQLNQALQNLQQTQVQLIQTEKMSSLGQMVAGIAHEIKNPLNFISNNLEYANTYTLDLLTLVDLYQQQYPNPTLDIQEHIQAIDLDFLIEDMPNILSSMTIGTERMYQLVLSLRNFSRLDKDQMQSVNLNEGIESTLVILNHQLKQGIEVVKQYGDLPLIECYPAQLNQVFMNIIQNAIDALQVADEQPNKKITITTQKATFNTIEVWIQDNGTGIPVAIKDKIFHPFFTTKDVGKGTGLGLSICHQIINKHQGQIEVSSHLGEGTNFAITLPIKQTLHTAVPKEEGGR